MYTSGTSHLVDDARGVFNGPWQVSARAGFTLIELVMAMLIVGVLLTIGVPRIDVSRFQMDSSIKQIASTVAAARGQAVLRQHDLVLTFDASEDLLYVLYDANNNRTMDTGERRRAVQLSENVTFGRGGADAIKGSTSEISFTKMSDGLPALTFHRNGAGSEEGVIYLTSTRGSEIGGFSTDTRALQVVRSTGRVRCHSFRTLAWLEGC